MVIAVIQPLNSSLGLTAPFEEGVLGLSLLDTKSRRPLEDSRIGLFYNPYVFFFTKDVKYFTLAMPGLL